MSDKVMRIKSAAFLRRKQWPEQEPASTHTLPTTNQDSRIIAALPVSQSLLLPPHCLPHRTPLKTHSLSKVTLTRCAASATSDVWRKVHSTRSEARLRSLKGSRVEEQPVRLNLMEKVDRIKAKHSEGQRAYEKGCSRAELIIKERCSSLRKQGERGDLERRIWQLLGPCDRANRLAEERYRARLLRLTRPAEPPQRPSLS